MSAAELVQTGLRLAAAGSTSETVGGYAVPVDPMEDLYCESCQ